MKCVIAANGSLEPTSDVLSQIESADLIIAADGGAVHLHRMNILPDVIIGDLDSISPEATTFFTSKQVPIKTHPPAKDQTDTELCIDYALERGCTQIVLTGVTGHRLDHTLGNVFLLNRLARRGIQGKIIDARNEIHLVKSRLDLSGTKGDLLSVIPVSETVTGLTLKGLQYPLKNKTLPMGTCLGVSNCFTGSRAQISIDSGMVLVIKSRE